MKAKPVRVVQGVGYVQCSPDEASHVMLEVPGPTGHLTLPVILRGKREGTGCWTWNGDTEAPTLRPSVLTNGTYRLTDEEHATLMAGGKIEPRRFRCHSWINDGAAQFLSDSTHELAAQTVPLLDIEPDPKPCKRCHGEGCTNEGDPEIGNAYFECSACGGTGKATDGVAGAGKTTDGISNGD